MTEIALMGKTGPWPVYGTNDGIIQQFSMRVRFYLVLRVQSDIKNMHLANC